MIFQVSTLSLAYAYEPAAVCASPDLSSQDQKTFSDLSASLKRVQALRDLAVKNSAQPLAARQEAQQLAQEIAWTSAQKRWYLMHAMALAEDARLETNQNLKLIAWRRTIAALVQNQSNPLSLEPLPDSPSVIAQWTEVALREAALTLLNTAIDQHDETNKQRILSEVVSIMEQRNAAELTDYFQDQCVADFRQRTSNLLTTSQLTDTAALLIITFENHTDLLLVHQGRITQHRSPVGRSVIAPAVLAFRNAVETRTTRRYLPMAQQLNAWLIEPLRQHLLQSQIHTLLISADGSTRGLPFAALHNGQKFLIEQFALGLIPGLSLTDSQRRSKVNASIFAAGISDPVQGFKSLPHVAQELDSIAQRHQAIVIRNEQFSADSLQLALIHQPFRVVHIASHGEFSETAVNSYVLTYNDRISMNNLQQLIAPFRFRDEPIDLLALSACQTASGDERANLGLAGAALKAGARSVLASLWYINDDSSMQLVTEFYQNLVSNDLSKAQALQKAQRRLISDERYNHPGYWGAFVLVGNWR